MIKQISPYIIKVDEFGNEYTIDNPIYKEKIIKEKHKLLFKKSGIPSFYWNINFKDYRGDKESKEIRKIIYYAENCHKEKFNHVHLYLWGVQSTQKSALMYNIGKQAIQNGLSVKTILANTLISHLLKLQGYGTDEDIYYKIKELKECKLLLIDDVGDIDKSTYWNKSKNLVISEWDGFLREVVASDTRVVMTSNFDVSIFKQYFGDSLYELIDRNFVQIQLTQSVKSIRKLNVNKVFEEID